MGELTLFLTSHMTKLSSTFITILLVFVALCSCNTPEENQELKFESLIPQALAIISNHDTEAAQKLYVQISDLEISAREVKTNTTIGITNDIDTLSRIKSELTTNLADLENKVAELEHKKNAFNLNVNETKLCKLWFEAKERRQKAFSDLSKMMTNVLSYSDTLKGVNNEALDKARNFIYSFKTENTIIMSQDESAPLPSDCKLPSEQDVIVAKELQSQIDNYRNQIQEQQSTINLKDKRLDALKKQLEYISTPFEKRLSIFAKIREILFPITGLDEKL
eukprot:c21348_g2_i1.p1 GENE.c21348_g2_i1~~c21348_g2_i1.p1  ORF type:complete len:279 (-),score=87.62 c21348_g2_i1:4-840(-)